MFTAPAITIPDYTPPDYNFVFTEEGKPVLDTSIRNIFSLSPGLAEVYYNKSSTLVVEGPAGTGKTRTILELLYLIAIKYPKTSIAITRAVRATIPNSVLKTFEDSVLPENSPLKEGATRENRDSYKFPNGSEIVIIGFNDPGKLLSTEWNIIYVNEADQVPYDTLMTAQSRLHRPRPGYPTHRLILDLNPTFEQHWIYKQGWDIIYTYHHDNPALWQAIEGGTVPHPATGVAGEWTVVGKKYVEETLATLRGELRARFYEGKRILPLGLIYGSCYDPKIHHITSLLLTMKHMIDTGQGTREQAEKWFNDNGRIMASADFNFVVPLSFGFYFVDFEKRGRQICEFYRSWTTIEEACKECLEFLGWEYVDRKHTKLKNPPLGFSVPLPAYFICDHDAEDRQTLTNHFGIKTKPAMKAVTAGIDAVAQRFLEGTIFIDDIEPIGGVDISMQQKNQPTRLAEEILRYTAKTDERNGIMKPMPDKSKGGDHAVDRFRYWVAELDGIKSGDTKASSVPRLSSMSLNIASLGNIPLSIREKVNSTSAVGLMTWENQEKGESGALFDIR